MGSQRLKKKTELNYRKGRTGHHCSYCNHFVSRFEVKLIGGETKGFEPRCRIMGLQMSIKYRINPENLCDAYDNSEYLQRPRG
jgi:hypothetical protein